MVPSEDSILTNLRRGTVEYCVLAALTDGPRYGLDIARDLSADRLIMDGEGTLYPLLARMRRAGLVETTWQESPTGPPRRYYRLTHDGDRALRQFVRAWGPFRDAVTAHVAPRRR